MTQGGLTGKQSTAFRAAQVVRQRTITTRSVITNECRTRSAGNDRTNELRDANIVQIEHRRFGKKGDGVALCGDLGFVVGIDIEGMEISVAVADAALAPLAVRIPRRTFRNIEQDPHGALDCVAEMVGTAIERAKAIPDSRGKLFGASRLIGVGLSMPAPIRRSTRAISHATRVLPQWQDLTPGEELSARLKASLGFPCRVVIENDASLGALGVYSLEVLEAADPDEIPQDLIYVRVSIGIGAGIVMKGKLIGGAAGFAGELGHIKVDDHGPLCASCGQRGCVETKAAASFVLGQVRGQHRGIMTLQKGDNPIEKLVTSTHPACGRALSDAGWYVGVALAHACTMLDPKRIYLGGTMTESLDFVASLGRAIHQTANPTVGRTAAQDAELRSNEALRRDQSAFSELAPDFIQRVSDLGFASRNLTPELLGALAVVVHKAGDDFIQARVQEKIAAGS